MSADTATIKKIQQKVGVAADGIIGPKTLAAISAALGIPAAQDSPRWPTQAQVRAGSSIFGKPGNESALVNIVPAYPLYYEGKRVKTIRVHEKIAAHVQDILREVLEHYGQEAITRLGLDQYGGSYNYRNNTGGSALSMHAWGIALDFAPATNAYSTKAPKATLSCPECNAWWEIWERHGAVSLGRSAGCDWMHVQFAKLK